MQNNKGEGKGDGNSLGGTTVWKIDGGKMQCGFKANDI